MTDTLFWYFLIPVSKYEDRIEVDSNHSCCIMIVTVSVSEWMTKMRVDERFQPVQDWNTLQYDFFNPYSICFHSLMKIQVVEGRNVTEKGHFLMERITRVCKSERKK